MGTINYKSNKYITLGVNMLNIYEECKELEINDFHYCVDDEVETLWEEISNTLLKYTFEYFEVELVNGYSDGFYLDINDKGYIYFDNTKEKNDTLKEATKLKELMLELVENGLVACFPGWATTYLNTKDTVKEINKAIKEIKKDIQTIPTYRNYKKEA
jgi:hypothetical protein